MKKLLLATAILSASLTAQAQQEDTCPIIGMISYSVMQSRQSGVDINSLIQWNEKKHGDFYRITKDMISEAYTWERPENKFKQKVLSANFSDVWFNRCRNAK